MIRDRRPLLHTFADKVAVRDYVAAKIGVEFLTSVFVIANDPAEVDWRSLPREYACKPSHSWGRAVLVREGASTEARLPTGYRIAGRGYHHLHPDWVEPEAMRALLGAWLRTPHGWGPGSGYEWAYLGIPPRILIEELLTGSGDQQPEDYKFWVFNGRCRRIQYVKGLASGGPEPYVSCFLTPEWELTDTAKVGSTPLREAPPRPPVLGQMIQCAERLAVDTDFLRVDQYAIGQRIVVGELTNYPGGGTWSLHPEGDHMFGRWWTLPRRYDDPLRY